MGKHFHNGGEQTLGREIEILEIFRHWAGGPEQPDPPSEVSPAWSRGWGSDFQRCLPTQTALDLDGDHLPEHLNDSKSFPRGKPRMESTGWGSACLRHSSLVCFWCCQAEQPLVQFNTGTQRNSASRACANQADAEKLFWHLMSHCSSALKVLCICLSFAKWHQYECVWFCKVWGFFLQAFKLLWAAWLWELSLSSHSAVIVSIQSQCWKALVVRIQPWCSSRWLLPSPRASGAWMSPCSGCHHSAGQPGRKSCACHLNEILAHLRFTVLPPG